MSFFRSSSSCGRPLTRLCCAAIGTEADARGPHHPIDRRPAGLALPHAVPQVCTDSERISRYENGRLTPSVAAIVRLAEAVTSPSTTSSSRPPLRRPLQGPDLDLGERLADLGQLDEDDRAAVLCIVDGLLAAASPPSSVPSRCPDAGGDVRRGRCVGGRGRPEPRARGHGAVRNVEPNSFACCGQRASPPWATAWPWCCGAPPALAVQPLLSQDWGWRAIRTEEAGLARDEQ